MVWPEGAPPCKYSPQSPLRKVTRTSTFWSFSNNNLNSVDDQPREEGIAERLHEEVHALTAREQHEHTVQHFSHPLGINSAVRGKKSKFRLSFPTRCEKVWKLSQVAQKSEIRVRNHLLLNARSMQAVRSRAATSSVRTAQASNARHILLS